MKHMSLLVVLGALLMLGVLVSLVRTVVKDGYGSRPAPRSHPEEVGSWVEQQLRR